VGMLGKGTAAPGRPKTRRAPMLGARKTSFLEQPDEEQDDDDERDETAADVHSGLLLVS
jgi:hypothetical protein